MFAANSVTHGGTEWRGNNHMFSEALKTGQQPPCSAVFELPGYQKRGGVTARHKMIRLNTDRRRRRRRSCFMSAGEKRAECVLSYFIYSNSSIDFFICTFIYSREMTINKVEIRIYLHGHLRGSFDLVHGWMVRCFWSCWRAASGQQIYWFCQFWESHMVQWNVCSLCSRLRVSHFLV